MLRSWLVLFFFSFALQGFAQLDTVRLFMFGHSLMDHRPPLIATPSDETTIAHWMAILANAANNEFSATGQFGFLGSHAANLPPDSQWGYDSVQTSWNASATPLNQAKLDQVMFTPLNYVQWQAANIPYSGSSFSPQSAGIAIMDYMTAQLPDSPRMYIYENWPDMSGYLGGGSFPPNATQLGNYHLYSSIGFHNWFLDFQDSLVANRPAIDVKMIPVGPVLTQILTQAPYDTIPITEVYEDDAPHGRASLYFMAGLITYMALYEEKAPATYTPPSIVHTTIRSNYNTLVDYIWAQLQSFNYANGDSRVFFGNNFIPLSIEGELQAENTLSVQSFAVYPNPNRSGKLFLELPEGASPLQVEVLDLGGKTLMKLSGEAISEDGHLDVSRLGTGYYFVKILGKEGVYVSKLILEE